MIKPSLNNHDFKLSGHIGGTANGDRQRAKTHCPKGHPYSGENLYINPQGQRICKTCRDATRTRSRQQNRRKVYG